MDIYEKDNGESKFARTRGDESIEDKQYGAREGGSYHGGGVELRDDVVEEGREVRGTRLELLDVVEAVALAVCLQRDGDTGLHWWALFFFC